MAREGRLVPAFEHKGYNIKGTCSSWYRPHRVLVRGKALGTSRAPLVLLVLFIARDAVVPPVDIVAKTTAHDGKHGGLCPSCPYPGTGRPWCLVRPRSSRPRRHSGRSCWKDQSGRKHEPRSSSLAPPLSSCGTARSARDGTASCLNP